MGSRWIGGRKQSAALEEVERRRGTVEFGEDEGLERGWRFGRFCRKLGERRSMAAKLKG